MNYLTKLFFFNPSKTAPKCEIFISSNAIDFLSWYKKENEPDQGTMIHTNMGKEINHIVEGVPENVNQIAYDGLFFKCTCNRLNDGSMKKFTAWINPDNILCVYSIQPNDCQIFFKSGKIILIVNKTADVMKALIEHNKKYKERKKLNYGK
jgi:hypothetical protein